MIVYQALLLIGVAGVGKSTVAAAAGSVLTSAGHVTAVVDTDALAQIGPALADGRSYDELKCANLAALWTNFKAAGARFAVVAAGIDSLPLRKLYTESLTGCEVRLVRLTAEDVTVRSRLRQRDIGSKLEKHLSALDEYRRLPPAIAVEDFAVDNNRDAEDVATEILVRIGWVNQETQAS